MRLILPFILLCIGACADRTSLYSREDLADQPRYCGDEVYTPQPGMEAVALAEAALLEPGTYKCRQAQSVKDLAIQGAVQQQP